MIAAHSTMARERLIVKYRGHVTRIILQASGAFDSECQHLKECAMNQYIPSKQIHPLPVIGKSGSDEITGPRASLPAIFAEPGAQPHHGSDKIQLVQASQGAASPTGEVVQKGIVGARGLPWQCRTRLRCRGTIYQRPAILQKKRLV